MNATYVLFQGFYPILPVSVAALEHMKAGNVWLCRELDFSESRYQPIRRTPTVLSFRLVAGHARSPTTAKCNLYASHHKPVTLPEPQEPSTLKPRTQDRIPKARRLKDPKPLKPQVLNGLGFWLGPLIWTETKLDNSTMTPYSNPLKL